MHTASFKDGLHLKIYGIAAVLGYSPFVHMLLIESCIAGVYRCKADTKKTSTVQTCIRYTHRLNTKPKQEERSSQAEIYKYNNRVDVAVGVVALGVEMKET